MVSTFLNNNVCRLRAWNGERICIFSFCCLMDTGPDGTRGPSRGRKRDRDAMRSEQGHRDAMRSERTARYIGLKPDRLFVSGKSQFPLKKALPGMSLLRVSSGYKVRPRRNLFPFSTVCIVDVTWRRTFRPGWKGSVGGTRSGVRGDLMSLLFRHLFL